MSEKAELPIRVLKLAGQTVACHVVSRKLKKDGKIAVSLRPKDLDTKAALSFLATLLGEKAQEIIGSLVLSEILRPAISEASAAALTVPADHDLTKVTVNETAFQEALISALQPASRRSGGKAALWALYQDATDEIAVLSAKVAEYMTKGQPAPADLAMKFPVAVAKHAELAAKWREASAGGKVAA